MLPYQTLFEQLNQVVVQQFGEVTTVLFLPKQTDGSEESVIEIEGIITVPRPEDFLPGGTEGTTNVYLFVDYTSIIPNPLRGGVIVIDTVCYDIGQFKIDAIGGARLLLKKNGATYNA
jgi:hypothetical protein